MKRNCVLLGFLLLSNFAFGQTNSFPSTGSATIYGNVNLVNRGNGFYIDHTALSETLSGASTILGNNIKTGTTNNTVKRFLSATDPGAFVGLNWSTGITFHTGINSALNTEISAWDNEVMRLTHAGNVGIGNNAPAAKLEITGGPVWTTNGWLKSVKLQSGAAMQLSAANAKFGFGATDNDGLFFFTTPADDVSRSASYIMSMRANGNVGIGVLNATEKLSVKGKIRAQEVKIEMNGWPDFVFGKDYLLPTLQETEKHIKEKGRLPGIPSAAEVEKNGIELGDMNKKLLQKIEELTLYLIEMKKENNLKTSILQTEINDLKLKLK
ncbi:hypothetical protein [Pedobacter ginsengisoli]|uniref:hypothetical protein n=1 Tax=Pedobacter ginsengisoli TaxID=363852 RepID=UPI00254A3B95|nr:hypothetical protein [Pedobacter ginsengisoli]